MKSESYDATIGLDHAATLDEIRTALAPFEEHDDRRATGNWLEIPSDFYGYVRISAEDLEFLSTVEDTIESLK